MNLSTALEPAFVKLASIVPRTNGETVATIASGSTLWMPPGYRDTRTVVTGLFQQDETRLFELLVKPGMTVVDLGAYVGYFTILSSHLVGSSGRVVAFEPEAFAYQYLLKNIAANGCQNVLAVNKAVSDGLGTMTLVRDPLGPETFVASNQQLDDSMVVEAVSLDSFLEGEDWPVIDLIKMNIEGSEFGALAGMRKVSRRNPHLKLVMEFNPTSMARSGVSPLALTNILAELGFRQGQVVERGLEVIPSGDLLPVSDAVYNVLLIK